MPGKTIAVAIVLVLLNGVACSPGDRTPAGPASEEPARTSIPVEAVDATHIPTTTPPAETHTLVPTIPLPTATALPLPEVAANPDRCPEPWFFTPVPQGCPDLPPLRSFATTQPFEHGLMIWVEQTAQIYVFGGDLNSALPVPYVAVPDPYQPGMPRADPALTPPEGLIQPELGFGMVWRGEAGSLTFDPRETLGWALRDEVGYTALYQCGVPVDRAGCFLLAQGGAVIAMSDSRAAFWPAE